MEISDERVEKVKCLLSKFFCVTLVKRILCIVLLAFGVEDEIIRRALGLSCKSFKKYKAMLDSNEYSRLLRMGEHKRSGELDDYREVIFAELDRGEYRTLREIAVMIEMKTGLKRSRNRINIFLRKNGYTHLKVGFFPGESERGKATGVLQGNP
jgi:transposase